MAPEMRDEWAEAVAPLSDSITTEHAGTRPLDFWTPPTTEPYGPLQPGRHYRLILPFHDADGEMHPEGEVWLYLGHADLPAEDGVALFVSFDGEQSWNIPLLWAAEAQGTVLENLEDYLVE